MHRPWKGIRGGGGKRGSSLSHTKRRKKGRKGALNPLRKEREVGGGKKAEGYFLTFPGGEKGEEKFPTLLERKGGEKVQTLS